MEMSYNARCPAVKRLLKEAQELHEPTEEYYAQPLDDNLFEWHFTLRGPLSTEFEEGIYHGRIILPSEYPMKPPDIIFITPNGRFETNKKICLSISGHHPELWRPSWSIRTALLAIVGYMPSSGLGTLASLQYTPEERKILAKRSINVKCPDCGDLSSVLLPRTSENAHNISAEAKELSKQLSVTEKPLNETQKTNATTAASASAPARPASEGVQNTNGSSGVTSSLPATPDPSNSASLRKQNINSTSDQQTIDSTDSASSDTSIDSTNSDSSSPAAESPVHVDTVLTARRRAVVTPGTRSRNTVTPHVRSTSDSVLCNIFLLVCACLLLVLAIRRLSKILSSNDDSSFEVKIGGNGYYID